MRHRCRFTLPSAICLCALAPADMVTRRSGTPPKGQPGRQQAKQLPPPTGYAPECNRAPTVDGALKDDEWRGAYLLRLDRTLDGTGAAAQPTEVRLLRHRDLLYVGARCIEPLLDKLRATRRGHDGEIWGDDSIEIFLGIGGQYCHLGVNALASTYDGRAKNASWNSGLKAAAGRGPREWTLEIAIPLSAIAGEGKLPEEWIADFNRNRYVTGRLEESSWSPTYSGDSHVPERFGKLLLRDPPKEAKEQVRAPHSGEGTAQFLPAKNGQGVIRFDLSDLPRGARIHRAELLAFRSSKVEGTMDEALVASEVFPVLTAFAAGGTALAAGEPLGLLGPWYDRFDATEAVKQWVGGKPNGGFFFKRFSLWNKEATCLDVSYEGKPDEVPPPVTGLKAHHRAGQTFLTWKEIRDPVAREEIRWGELKSILDGLDRQERLRYCVYRHGERVTAKSLHKAERIAVVRPLSCWNINGRNIDRPVDKYIATQEVLMTGHLNPFRVARLDGKYGRDCSIDRLVIHDGKEPLPSGTGLYVHTSGERAKAFYAVVTCLDGVQNTRDFSEANSLAAPVEEQSGEGEPVLQRQIPPMPFFNFKQERLHYVRWVAPPYVNVPSQYYNWTVGVPLKIGSGIPLELNLHRDGHSYWRTHYRLERDSISLSPHDFPIKSWWYGYHEAAGTLRSLRQGVIQPYTERRLLSFIEWASKKWPIDRNRILVTGCGGGASGTGALHLALRHRDLFNLAVSGHPVVDCAAASRATDRRKAGAALSLQAVWGKADWGLKTESGRTVWQEHDMNRLVTGLPRATELPMVTMTSNHGDAVARRFYDQMLARHHPIIASFSWGGTRYVPVSSTGTSPNAIRLDVRKDRPLLAFVSPEALGLVKGAKMGAFNTDFRWRDIVDRPDRFEVTVTYRGRGKGVADVALRRLQNFRAAPGKTYPWKIVAQPGDAEVQSGEVTPGPDGLLVLRGVRCSGRITVSGQ